MNILIKAFFMAMVAVTVDVLWGYTGYLSFGQSAFFGIGAYAAGLTFTHSGFSGSNAVIAIGAAVIVSMVIAYVVGWLSFYRGASPFFATVISLVLPIVLVQLILSGGSWTGSSSGLTGYETFDLSIEAWYWIALSDYESPTTLRLLLDSNAHGVITKPFRSSGVLSTLVLARSSQSFQSRLKGKIDKLEDTIKSRRQIEKSIRVITQSQGLTEIQAYEHMRARATKLRVTVAEIAAMVLDAQETMARLGLDAPSTRT